VNARIIIIGFIIIVLVNEYQKHTTPNSFSVMQKQSEQAQKWPEMYRPLFFKVDMDKPVRKSKGFRS
jgi:hypothetical protein